MDSELQATLLLQHLPGLGAKSYWRLIEAFGSPLAVLEQSGDELKTLLKAPAFEALQDYWKNPESSELGQLLQRDQDWLAKHSEVKTLSLGSPDYPPLLREIHRPPPLLYVRGNLDALNLPQLAVVGSRSPTAGGLDNARRFSHYLAANGFAITSGLALGVDGAAHLGALEAGGVTIAVLGTGIDRIYPSRHRALAERILANNGALVSEFPLGTGPQAGNFPQRNRIISGLSAGTLVVEAALQSGSLITARHALQDNREVFAIPGSIHNPLARGCHSLIRQGATLVESGADLVRELGALLGYQQSLFDDSARSLTADNAVPEASFTLEEQAVLTALGHDPQDLDSLSERSGFDVGRLAAYLISLELKGAVTETPNGYVRTVELLAVD